MILTSHQAYSISSTKLDLYSKSYLKQSKWQQVKVRFKKHAQDMLALNKVQGDEHSFIQLSIKLIFNR